MAPLLGDNGIMGAYAGAADPVVAAATAHLNSPVVFNFVSKASLADCVIHGTTAPSMSYGSFASGASGFPFNNDATVDTGITSTGVAGEFIGIYVTGIDTAVEANTLLMGTLISAGINIRTLSSANRAFYGGNFQNFAYDDGTQINSAGAIYLNNSLIGTITFSSDSASQVYIGGYAATSSRATKANIAYAVYAPSIATSAAAAASAIHTAMVAGAP